MAKRIIVLEQPNDESTKFTVLFWLSVPAARQSFYAKPGAVSKWPGASQAENDAIAAGQVKEEVGVYSRPGGSGMAQVQADLEADWATKQALVDAYNPWNFYGSFWDSATGWTIAGV